jgi:archaemetzincin
MILCLLHDRDSLTEMASLKRSIEDCYSPYTVHVYNSRYFYVPFIEPKIDAANLLRYLSKVCWQETVLLVVNKEIFYPGIGAVFGCSADRFALISRSGLDNVALKREALHEVGHLLGLEHCSDYCVMGLSESKEDAGRKPSILCTRCSTLLRSKIDL